MCLARKSCSYLLLLPRFDYGICLGCRSFDGQAHVRTPPGVIRCRTVRQLSAEERWDEEFVLNIKETPWSPDGGRVGDANIRVDFLRLEATGVRIPQILTHQSFSGECASSGRCSRGLVSPPDVWVAVPSEQELGTLETTLSAVAKGLSMISRSSLRELSRSLATERIKRATHEERARNIKIEDPDQRPDREVIEGTGASSSRDRAGNEPPSRPAESSANVDPSERAER